MTSPILQPGGEPLRGAQQSSKAASAQGVGASESTGGPAFRALLERLQAQAARLDETSKSVEHASDLTNAVDAARASLEDAVSLSDSLLEAFRQSQVQPDDGAESE